MADVDNGNYHYNLYNNDRDYMSTEPYMEADMGLFSANCEWTWGQFGESVKLVKRER